MNTFLSKDESGKVIFTGKEDPNNPPSTVVKNCKHGSDTCSHMRCPMCFEWVDYLLGYGADQACEGCYKPDGGRKVIHENTSQTGGSQKGSEAEEIVFD